MNDNIGAKQGYMEIYLQGQKDKIVKELGMHEVEVSR
jgi:hypothetical protein